MVSNASDDLPDPDRPVITISLSRGRSRSMFLRLCVRAPRILMASISVGGSAEANGPAYRNGRFGGNGRVGQAPGRRATAAVQVWGRLDPNGRGHLQFRSCLPSMAAGRPQ